MNNIFFILIIILLIGLYLKKDSSIPKDIIQDIIPNKNTNLNQGTTPEPKYKCDIITEDGSKISIISDNNSNLFKNSCEIIRTINKPKPKPIDVKKPNPKRTPKK